MKHYVKYNWTQEQDKVIIDNKDNLSYRLIKEQFFPDIPLFAIKQRGRKLKIKKRRFKLYQKYIDCKICNNKIFVTNQEESLRKTCSYECLVEFKKLYGPKKVFNPLISFLKHKTHRVRSNAKTRTIEFTLNWKDLLEIYNKQDGLCYYTGLKLETEFTKNQFKCCSPFQLSVDRIDSNVGYYKDNIVLCCYAINNLKGEFDKKTLKLFFKTISNNNGEIFNEIKIQKVTS